MINLAELSSEQRALLVKALSTKFSLKIFETHDEDEFALVVERTELETDPSVCHSHDFCDANELMMLAYCETMGLTEDEFDLTDDRVMGFITEAWDLSKASRFAQ